MLAQDSELLHYTNIAAESIEVSSKQQSVGAVSSEFWKMLTACAILIAAFAFPYILTGAIAQNGYEMQTLRAQIMALEKQNETARLEIARLESPSRIQYIAETQLGMQVPVSAIYGGSDGPRTDQQSIRE